MTFICKNCGYVGSPKMMTKGSFLMELVLWILLIVPGIIYSIWRITTRYKSCLLCKSPDIVPIESPLGRKLIAEISRNSTSSNPLQKEVAKPETSKGVLNKLRKHLRTETEVGNVDSIETSN